MSNQELNRKKDLEIITKMDDKELSSFLWQTEESLYILIDLQGNNHPETEETMILMDMIAGEMIRRQDKARNSNVTKPETPEAPNTFYQLMSLGDGNVDESSPY